MSDSREEKIKKERAKKLVAIALANFPHLQDKDMGPTVVLWMKILSDIPYDVVQAALAKVLATAKFWPTVAEIREAAAAISSPFILSPAEAWGQVIKAVQEYGYYRSGEGLATLDKTVQKAVQAFGGFREICMSENIDVVRAQFMRMYGQFANREKETAVLPESVKNFIGGVAKSLPA
ncbi:Loader and inhibitor of phage G40P [Pelotomaculum sp. FP]|uniref:replicative helicase loader/inhibitor n=1 Tax=Pelotomaculum sp. FP TaxID=261474 RepID=UPI0010662396|nr:replicative helicase loader/inhibitor [Pelotomaculum sp. FP]TEB15158.1 Loader and inhibitor of phage G40P [Pelotomaculum sp. FP]